MKYLFTLTENSYEFDGDYYISDNNEIINVSGVGVYVVVFEEEYAGVSFILWHNQYKEIFIKDSTKVYDDIEEISMYEYRVAMFKTILEREKLNKILESI